MAINVRTKGQTGEREIAKFFNDIYAEVYEELGMTLPEKDIAQRRQNQSAVGGSDLDNTCGYSVEVKRQEKLAINTWWDQCVVSAKEDKNLPVLMYRQNNKKWRVVLYMYNMRLFESEAVTYHRAEISLDDFRIIFKSHALEYIRHNGSAK
ncbi:hypothetical protein [Vibrio phage vB_VibM_83AMN]|nr:hypothetical protein [Vibrio phage vB_VibM_83AMN]